MFGTIVNAMSIIAGSLIGLLFRGGISEKYNRTMMHAIGLAVVLIGVEVHQGDNLGVEDWTLGPHLPATEVLPQGVTHDLVAVRRREASALEDNRGTQLALGKSDHAAIVVVADVHDVLSDEAHVGPRQRFTEYLPVVVATANPHVRA